MDCKIERGIKSDFNVLNKCIRGKSVSEIHNSTSINRLASVGLVRLGTEEILTPDGRIELRPTVKATDLGRRISKFRK